MGLNDSAGREAKAAKPSRAYTLAAVYLLALILTAAGAGDLAASTGDYTQAQASAGHQVYAQHCATCHGPQLQGQAGPPLAGKKFESNLEYSKMSAGQLYAFIKTQMPANAPASLSQQQYLTVMAYILKQNGYPQGATPLSENTLGQVKLLPYPGQNGAAQGQANAHSQ